MTDQELLQAMKQMLQESEARMKTTIQEEVQPIREELAEGRDGVNTLLEWAEKAGSSIEFPTENYVSDWERGGGPLPFFMSWDVSIYPEWRTRPERAEGGRLSAFS